MEDTRSPGIYPQPQKPGGFPRRPRGRVRLARSLERRSQAHSPRQHFRRRNPRESDPILSPAASTAASPTRQQRPSDLEGNFSTFSRGSQDLQGERLEGDHLQGAWLQPSCRRMRTTTTTPHRTTPWPSVCQPSGPISQESGSHKQRPNSLFVTSQLTSPSTPIAALPEDVAT